MKLTLISHSSNAAGDSLADQVAYCARVSNPSNQMNKETNEKLLKYLMQHKHWSPFEMVSVCMEIETTRDIARQILRHRSFSFQEFSQRYAKADLGFVTRDGRLQDLKNRQNSLPVDDSELNSRWKVKQQELISQIHKTYCWALESGIAKEQARSILPEGNTLSRLYMNGTLRSWLHYIELRQANGTQLEHMEVAKECAKVLSEIFPLEE
jgi:thymidylate synthase (FAD)